MIWNYRIIHHDKKGTKYLAVHEVFYDEKGRIESWTADPIDVSGETKKEVLETLRMMLKDVTNQGILRESELEAGIKKREQLVTTDGDENYLAENL